jgi:hypothetical protein
VVDIWFSKLQAFKLVIVPSIREFFLDFPAHQYAPAARIDSHVAPVEQSVQIAPQKKTVPNLMSLNEFIRLDVRSV